MIHFSTPLRKSYTVTDKGYITPDATSYVKASPSWQLLGIRRVHAGRSTSHFIPFSTLLEKAKDGTLGDIQWRYKTSNNPRWTIEDLDHGTRRTWGNTTCHGVRSMWYREDE